MSNFAKLMAAIFLVLLVACQRDIEVSREYGVARTEVRNVGCTYSAPGYCMDCGISYGGGFDCYMRFKPFCSHPGTKRIKAEIVPVTITYRSGLVRQTERVKEIERISGCAQ